MHVHTYCTRMSAHRYNTSSHFKTSLHTSTFPIGARCNCPRESQHALPCCLASRTNACACRCQEQCHAYAIYCMHVHRYYTSSHFSISLRMSTFRCARCTGVAACVVIASPQNKFRVQTCHVGVVVGVGVAPLCDSIGASLRKSP